MSNSCRGRANTIDVVPPTCTSAGRTRKARAYTIAIAAVSIEDATASARVAFLQTKPVNVRRRERKKVAFYLPDAQPSLSLAWIAEAFGNARRQSLCSFEYNPISPTPSSMISLVALTHSVSDIAIVPGKWRDSIEISIFRKRSNALRIIERTAVAQIDEEVSDEDSMRVLVRQSSIMASQSHSTLITTRSSWNVTCDAALCDALLEDLLIQVGGGEADAVDQDGGGLTLEAMAPCEPTYQLAVIHEESVESSCPAEVPSTTPARSIVKRFFARFFRLQNLNAMKPQRIATSKEQTKVSDHRLTNALNWANLTIRRNKKTKGWQEEDEWDAMIRAADETFEFD